MSDMSVIDFDRTDCFFVENSDGTTVKCDVLVSFKNDRGSFVVYTDGSKNENGSIRAFASRCDSAVSSEVLLPIEEEDRNFVESVLECAIKENIRRARINDVRGVRKKGFARRRNSFSAKKK